MQERHDFMPVANKRDFNGQVPWMSLFAHSPASTATDTAGAAIQWVMAGPLQGNHYLIKVGNSNSIQITGAARATAEPASGLCCR